MKPIGYCCNKVKAFGESLSEQWAKKPFNTNNLSFCEELRRHCSLFIHYCQCFYREKCAYLMNCQHSSQPNKMYVVYDKVIEMNVSNIFCRSMNRLNKIVDSIKLYWNRNCLNNKKMMINLILNQLKYNYFSNSIKFRVNKEITS